MNTTTVSQSRQFVEKMDTEKVTPEQVEKWNGEFASLSVDERFAKAYEIFGYGLIATTSFGADSGILLHHLHRLDIPARVYFIDTSFHFPETLAYKDDLLSRFNLNLRVMKSKDPDNRKYAIEVANVIRIRDTKACCGINKVAVQSEFLGQDDVVAYMSGLRRDQSESRKNTPFLQLKGNKVKIAPIADFTQQDVDLYKRIWEIPEHPLVAKGYTSIGCSPTTCTSKPLPGQDQRSGRWAGESKTECGLHIDFNL